MIHVALGLDHVRGVDDPTPVDPYAPIARRAGRVLLAAALVVALPMVVLIGLHLVVLSRNENLMAAGPTAVLRSALPFELALLVWPLLLAALVLRTGWPALLGAVALTLGVMGAADAAGAGMTLWYGLRPRLRPLTRVQLDAARNLILVAWSARAILMFTLAYHVARMGRAWRRQTRRTPLVQSEARAITGRMSVFLAILFSLAWTGTVALQFVERIASRDPAFQAVATRYLRGILPTSIPREIPAAPRTPDQRRADAAVVVLNQGLDAMARADYLPARRALTRGLSEMETLHKTTQGLPGVAETRVLAFNTLAWLLATCPEPRLRDPGKAVLFARRAVDLDAQDGNAWNTLGVALYGAGKWSEAREAFDTAMSYRRGGDAYDWIFLAMISAREGKLDEARSWFRQAEKFRTAQRASDPELYRFHVEAAGLLDEPAPAPPLPSTPADPSVPQPLKR